MTVHPLAGKNVPVEMLENIPRLMSAYYVQHPRPEDPLQRIFFGTSGHRGTSTQATFYEDHVLAISQAICDFRRQQGFTGPLYLGMDTHAFSEAAFITTVEVMAANDVTLMVQQGCGYTPTPVISHAILTGTASSPAAMA